MASRGRKTIPENVFGRAWGESGFRLAETNALVNLLFESVDAKLFFGGPRRRSFASISYRELSQATGLLFLEAPANSSFGSEAPDRTGWSVNWRVIPSSLYASKRGNGDCFFKTAQAKVTS